MAAYTCARAAAPSDSGRGSRRSEAEAFGTQGSVSLPLRPFLTARRRVRPLGTEPLPLRPRLGTETLPLRPRAPHAWAVVRSLGVRIAGGA
eukprot:4109731-Prymnesium_polylepis.1